MSSPIFLLIFNVSGSSVFGIKYKDGVVLAADTLASYGSLARFPDVQRVLRVNDTTIVACTGDFADFQFLSEILEQKQIDEEVSTYYYIIKNMQGIV